jgi:hypothetical protein
LRCIIRSLIWDLSVFLIYALMAINFLNSEVKHYYFVVVCVFDV